MDKKEADILRREVNERIREVQSYGLKSPTKYAYRYKQFPQLYFQPDTTRFGQIRSLESANRIALEKGYQTLTEEEYALAISDISKIEMLDVDKLRDYNVRIVLENLNRKDLSEKEYEYLANKIWTMKNKEVSDLIKGEKGSDFYTNIDNWISQNILDMNDK